MPPSIMATHLSRARRRSIGADRRRGAIRTAALFAGCVAFLLVSACEPRRQPGDGLPVVAVSVPPQAYFVERLARDLVRTEVMIPPGASPHMHDPGIPQVRAVGDAAMYVMIGHPSFPFERTWLDRLLAENREVRVVDCSEGLEQQEGDPHLWLSPRVVRSFVPRIATALRDLLPEHRDEISRRETEFLAEIDRLDSDIRSLLAGAGHRFYVFHPAWGYFARDYGLEQIPIESDNKEPDPHQLAALLKRAREEKARVIFVQPQFSKRSAELIAGEIGARVVVVDPLARDWEVSLRHAAAAFREGLS